MAVDLRLHDACSASNGALKATTWPDALTLEELASIQRPHNRGDAAGRKHRWALVAALKQACEAGELEHTAETVAMPPAVRRTVVSASRDEFASAEWKARAFSRQW